MSGQLTNEIFCGDIGSLGCSMIRAKAFHKVGGYDESLLSCEDNDLFLRMSLTGRWIYVEGEPVVFQQAHAPVYGGARQITRVKELQTDRLVTKAKVMERFIFQYGGNAVVPEKLWRRRIAKSWARVGVHQCGRVDFPAALKSFGRAIRFATGMSVK